MFIVALQSLDNTAWLTTETQVVLNGMCGNTVSACDEVFDNDLILINKADIRLVCPTVQCMCTATEKPGCSLHQQKCVTFIVGSMSIKSVSVQSKCD